MFIQYLASPFTNSVSLLSRFPSKDPGAMISSSSQLRGEVWSAISMLHIFFSLLLLNSRKKTPRNKQPNSRFPSLHYSFFFCSIIIFLTIQLPLVVCSFVSSFFCRKESHFSVVHLYELILHFTRKNWYFDFRNLHFLNCSLPLPMNFKSIKNTSAKSRKWVKPLQHFLCN